MSRHKKVYNREEEEAVKKFCELLEIVETSPGGGKRIDPFSIEYKNWRREVVLIEQYRQYFRYLKLKGRNKIVQTISRGDKIDIAFQGGNVIYFTTTAQRDVLGLLNQLRI